MAINLPPALSKTVVDRINKNITTNSILNSNFTSSGQAGARSNRGARTPSPVKAKPKTITTGKTTISKTPIKVTVKPTLSSISGFTSFTQNPTFTKKETSKPVVSIASFLFPDKTQTSKSVNTARDSRDSFSSQSKKPIKIDSKAHLNDPIFFPNIDSINIPKESPSKKTPKKDSVFSPSKINPDNNSIPNSGIKDTSITFQDITQGFNDGLDRFFAESTRFFTDLFSPHTIQDTTSGFTTEESGLSDESNLPEFPELSGIGGQAGDIQPTSENDDESFFDSIVKDPLKLGLVVVALSALIFSGGKRR